MDESAKRRERLKAMRLEAEQVGLTKSPAPSVPLDRLSNPFADALATTTPMNDPPTAPRFDYYTDPLSAFSTNKRRNVMNQEPGGKMINSMASFQIQMQSSPDQFHSGSQSSWRSPMASRLPPPSGSPIAGHTAGNPYSTGHSSSPYPICQIPMHYSPYQRPFEGNMYPPGTQSSWRSPMASPFQLPTVNPVGGHNSWTPFGSQPGHGVNITSSHPVHQPGNSPVHQVGNSSSSNYVRGSSSSPLCSRGGYNSGHGSGNSCSIVDVRGRGPRSFLGRGNDAPGSTSGLDRGRGHNAHDDTPSTNVGLDKQRMDVSYDDTPSPNKELDKGRSFELHDDTLYSGLRRGRWHKSLNNVSAGSKAQRYYIKSMVEDPWRHLKPVVKDLARAMTNTNASNSERPWLPKSVFMKEDEGLEKAIKFDNNVNLAVCLADSLKEATGDSSIV